jgi:hypothetical protein
VCERKFLILSTNSDECKKCRGLGYHCFLVHKCQKQYEVNIRGIESSGRSKSGWLCTRGKCWYKTDHAYYVLGSTLNALHIFFFSYLMVLGLELKALCLLSTCSAAWAMPLALFTLVILEIGSWFLPRLTWISIFLLFKTSLQCWDDGAYYHA